jgi:hypothetical protein
LDLEVWTGDGSAIALDDKALDEKGLYGKPGREDAVRRNNKTLNVRRLQQKPGEKQTTNRKTVKKKKMIVTCSSL